MKAIYIMALALFVCSCNEAKDDDGMGDDDATEESTEKVRTLIDVPDVVVNSFTTEYTDRDGVDWEEENGKYEVSFYNGSDTKPTSVIYNADGTKYATETDIDLASLPEAVSTAADNNGTATEASKMVLADGSVQYEVEVGNTEYIYAEDGTLISQMAGEEKDDDDDND